ncbi:MAG: hypothetical protein LM590_11815, partial [Thermofilum sp.]|nr:hypothetical protein [Thermofilum sp.]
MQLSALRSQDWRDAILHVRAGGGRAPAYPASYRVPVAVNGTPLGTASLRCGELAALGALLNATYGPR